MAELSAEVVEFLSEGTRTGMLGFLASDGRPLAAPGSPDATWGPIAPRNSASATARRTSW